MCDSQFVSVRIFQGTTKPIVTGYTRQHIRGMIATRIDAHAVTPLLKCSHQMLANKSSCSDHKRQVALFEWGG